mmetsp:Transcript_1570/g.4194  ORF Transcript_1570/g.4194 Transcript_1570/m.4194 type:complete len:300 (+) Transcript_1570:634-1533(+)
MAWDAVSGAAPVPCCTLSPCPSVITAAVETGARTNAGADRAEPLPLVRAVAAPVSRAAAASCRSARAAISQSDDVTMEPGAAAVMARAVLCGRLPPSLPPAAPALRPALLLAPAPAVATGGAAAGTGLRATCCSSACSCVQAASSHSGGTAAPRRAAAHRVWHSSLALYLARLLMTGALAPWAAPSPALLPSAPTPSAAAVPSRRARKVELGCACTVASADMMMDRSRGLRVAPDSSCDSSSNRSRPMTGSNCCRGCRALLAAAADVVTRRPPACHARLPLLHMCASAHSSMASSRMRS